MNIKKVVILQFLTLISFADYRQRLACFFPNLLDISKAVRPFNNLFLQLRCRV